MIQLGIPRQELRLGLIRGVFNGVYLTQIDVESTNYLEVAQYLKQLSPKDSSGVVRSHSFQSTSIAPTVIPLARKVFESLITTNLLTEVAFDEFEKSCLLLSSQGACPHTDVNVCADKFRLFWVLCLEDSDADIFFGNIGLRIPVKAGTLLVFDPCQPHAVISKEKSTFSRGDFSARRRQFFLSGDFHSRAWDSLGVARGHSSPGYLSAIDMNYALVHQRTCFVKTAP